MCPAHPATLPHLQLNGGVARRDRCQPHRTGTQARPRRFEKQPFSSFCRNRKHGSLEDPSAGSLGKKRPEERPQRGREKCSVLTFHLSHGEREPTLFSFHFKANLGCL